MKIIIRMSLSALLLWAMVSLALPQRMLAAEGGPAGTAGENDPGYTVKRGDTLWDISKLHLNDPFLWPRIWKLNPKISDPDLIYPGQKLELPGMTAGTAPGKGEAETAGAAGAGPGEGGKEEPFVERGVTIIKKTGEEGKIIPLDETKVKKIPVATVSDILQAGFIASSKDIEGARGITGGVLDDREAFLSGDKIFVKDTGGMKVGDRFISCRPGPRVTIPGTKAEVGRVAAVTGVVELAEKKDGYFVGRVTESFSAVSKSDLLVPAAEPELVYEPIPKNDKLEGVWGYIFAAKDEKVDNALGDVMYIGLGSKDGVRPGDRFTVRRSGRLVQRPDGHYLPAEYVLPDVEAGEAQVMAVQEESASVKVTASKEPVRAGYRVYYKY